MTYLANTMTPIDELVDEVVASTADSHTFHADSHTFHDDFRPREAVRRPTQKLYFLHIQIMGKGTHPEISETVDRLARPMSASLTISGSSFVGHVLQD